MELGLGLGLGHMELEPAHMARALDNTLELVGNIVLHALQRSELSDEQTNQLAWVHSMDLVQELHNKLALVRVLVHSMDRERSVF